MKKSFRNTLVVLLIALFSGTCLWAYNNILNNRENVKAKWGKRTSEDSDGSVRAKAYIDVDVDYPGEEWWIDLLKRYRITYEAKSEVRASFGWGREGHYSLSSAVPGSTRYKSKTWSWHLKDDLKAEKFDKRSDGNSLLDMDEDDIRSELDRCIATGRVNQDSNPSSGSEAYSSVASAY